MLPALTEFRWSPTHFVSRKDGRWTAFNPRTGQRMWSIDDPTPCPNSPYDHINYRQLPQFDNARVQLVDSDTRLAAVVDCATSEQAKLRLVSIDPSSGAVITDKTLITLNEVELARLNSWLVHGVDDTPVIILNLWRSGPNLSMYLNPDTGQRTDIPGAAWPASVGDGTFSVGDGDTFRVYSGDATLQCEFPLDGERAREVVLRDQIVVVGSSRSQMMVFDRATCGQVDVLPAPPDFQDFIVVRGATLLTNQLKYSKSATLVGFAP
jgi:hypothetical protein